MQENRIFAAFGFGLGRVQPPGVNTDLEKRIVQKLPVIFAGLSIESIVKRHAGGMKTGDSGLIDEKAFLCHVFVDGRTGTEKRPKRDHQVNILFVELVDHGLGFGIIFIPDRLAHGIPPEPVLDNIIERNMFGAIAFCDR